MSSVLANTRTLYKKVFVLEVIFILIGCFITYFSFMQQLSSFLLGTLIAVLPQIAFIGYALYCKADEPVTNKAKVLYQSEGLKLALTVSLFVLVFVCFPIKPAGLFLGYFLFVILNNLLPVLFNMKVISE